MIINFQRVRAFAEAENKITLRLIRYWVFLVIAYLLGLVIYANLSIAHAFSSTLAPSISMLGPRFLLSSIGFIYLSFFIFGVVFLAFEVRARDAREQMLGALDSRPYSNIDLVLGRFISLVLSSWMPLLIFVCILSILGLAISGLEAFEATSIVSFLFFISLPALMFCSALVFALSLIVRQQILAVVVCLLVLAGLYYLSSIASSSVLGSTLDFMGFSQQKLFSDIDPSLTKDSFGWIQRLGVILLTFSLLFLSALAHPRADSARKGAYSAITLSLALLGGGALFADYYNGQTDANQRQQWLVAHTAKQAESAPDIVAMQANVNIKPGEVIEASVSMNLTAPPGETLEQAIFSLNPGFEITNVSLVSSDLATEASKADFSFSDGLLNVQLVPALLSEQSISLKLEYKGKPDLRFGYLDSQLDINEISVEDGVIGFLGSDNLIFSNSAVALMPGSYWLPASGSDVKDHNAIARDFYDLELSVTLPNQWIAAGPGLRTEVAKTNEEITYQYQPDVSVPEVALIAGEYASFSVDVNDINFELLVHPSHADNFTQLSDFKDSFNSWLTDKLELLNDAGLRYPYRAFTIVEVPNSLRGFEGGWRMDTAFAPPSMALMRESGLPTARLSSLVNKQDSVDDVARIERGNGTIARLIDYNNNDFTGGNLFNAFVKSLMDHQVAATGSEAVALEYVLNQLATLVVADTRSYFSVEGFPEVNGEINTALAQSFDGSTAISRQVLAAVESRPEVWRGAMETPLASIQPDEKPALTVDILSFKSGAVAELIYDAIGAQKSGQFIAQLLTDFAGSPYRLEDVKRIAAEVDENLASILDDWLGSNSGPAGFIVDNVQVFQLPDDNNGLLDRYSLQLDIKNDEQYAGYTRVSWVDDINDNTRNYSDPIRIAGKEAVRFGITLNKPAYKVFLEPYAALNVEALLVRDDTQFDKAPEWGEEFQGLTTINWSDAASERIIVDDLDSGFSVLTGLQQGGEAVLKGQENDEKNLPLMDEVNFPGKWSRATDDAGWGKYRKTMVLKEPGNGNTKTSFQAELAQSGDWKLEIYLPNIYPVRTQLMGNWELEVITEEGVEPIKFDANSGLVGWNTVGTYNLPKGIVRVMISDKTEKIGIISDAIAWSKVK